MNIQQRLTQLERVIAPAKDTREPLLVRFLGVDLDEPDPDRLAGILYIYDGVPASEYRLNPEQLAEYSAKLSSSRNLQEAYKLIESEESKKKQAEQLLRLRLERVTDPSDPITNKLRAIAMGASV